jgi:hypothetical protein
VSAVAIRNDILDLERQMLEQPQVEIQPTHYFADGIYAREIVIPAGTLLTGKIHKTRHLNIISQGRIAVVTESGRTIIDAPYTFVAEAGTKRVGIALTDCVWTTIHASDETDLDKLEAQLIAPSFEALEADKKPAIEEMQWPG